MPENSPQIENGHIKIANELFEAMIHNAPMRVPDPFKVFLAVMRETYGFNRKEAQISTARFRELTGINDRRLIHRAKEIAIKSNMITVIKNDDTSTPIYSIIKDYSQWHTVHTVIKNDDSVIKNDDVLELTTQNNSVKLAVIKNDDVSGVIKNDDGRHQKRRRSSILKTPLETPRSLGPPQIKSKSLFPVDFQITDDMKSWFKTQKFTFDIQQETERWADYWKAKGKMMKDWTACWRNGMRLRQKWDKPSTPVTQKQNFIESEEDLERIFANE